MLAGCVKVHVRSAVCHDLGAMRLLPIPSTRTRSVGERARSFDGGRVYLVQVDDGLPEVGLLLVEVSHADLSEVTGMVLFPMSVARSNYILASDSRTLSMLVRWWC